MRQAFVVSLVALLTGAPVGAYADDVNERQLELEIQELRRQLQAQSRRLDQLERSSSRSIGRAVSPWAETIPPAPPEASPWLVAANWDRIRVGMSAAEVTRILGAPSSERAGDGGAHVLLYALEIQEGVFLAGRVEMQDDNVTAVQKPALR
jgi:hypothetical protein